ncbi:hypothetical protein N0V90_005641 [Kalmusia sp. IMI 367209]|nr:hypothetical protein N0V90_005641 [Kalmusia sp. IMI 367209]
MFTTLATAFVAARLASKWLKKTDFTLDDVLLLAALVGDIEGRRPPGLDADIHQLLMYMLLAGAIIAVTIGHAGEPVSALTKPQLEATAMVS